MGRPIGPPRGRRNVFLDTSPLHYPTAIHRRLPYDSRQPVPPPTLLRLVSILRTKLGVDGHYPGHSFLCQDIPRLYCRRLSPPPALPPQRCPGECLARMPLGAFWVLVWGVLSAGAATGGASLRGPAQLRPRCEAWPNQYIHKPRISDALCVIGRIQFASGLRRPPRYRQRRPLTLYNRSPGPRLPKPHCTSFHDCPRKLTC